MCVVNFWKPNIIVVHTHTSSYIYSHAYKVMCFCERFSIICDLQCTLCPSSLSQLSATTILETTMERTSLPQSSSVPKRCSTYIITQHNKVGPCIHTYISSVYVCSSMLTVMSVYSGTSDGHSEQWTSVTIMDTSRYTNLHYHTLATPE